METQSPEKDLLDLLENNLKLREQLASLEKDSKAWNREREKDDLENITTLIKELGTNISQAMGDFNAFRIMNDLFQDLKTVKEELEQSYPHSDKLRQLKIDWAKLETTFEAMEKHVNSTREETEISLCILSFICC